MYTTQIRPVTDLRNKYTEVENDLENGPVILTKNGYGASVLISLDLYDKVLARQNLYAKIAQAEKDLDDGKGQDAFEALAEIRAKHHV